MLWVKPGVSHTEFLPPPAWASLLLELKDPFSFPTSSLLGVKFTCTIKSSYMNITFIGSQDILLIYFNALNEYLRFNKTGFIPLPVYSTGHKRSGPNCNFCSELYYVMNIELVAKIEMNI
jgi:hypothetical protein